MAILICDKGYFDGKKILCRKTRDRCGHVKRCELTMKWRQTEQAAKCPLREEERKEVKEDGGQKHPAGKNSSRKIRDAG